MDTQSSDMTRQWIYQESPSENQDSECEEISFLTTPSYPPPRRVGVCASEQAESPGCILIQPRCQLSPSGHLSSGPTSILLATPHLIVGSQL